MKNENDAAPVCSPDAIESTECGAVSDPEKHINFSQWEHEDRFELRQLGVSPGAVLVYDVLCMRAFYGDECWPTEEWIAAFLNMHRSTVVEHIKTLARVGAIVVRKIPTKGGNTFYNHYTIRHFPKKPLHFWKDIELPEKANANRSAHVGNSDICRISCDSHVGNSDTNKIIYKIDNKNKHLPSADETHSVGSDIETDEGHQSQDPTYGHSFLDTEEASIPEANPQPSGEDDFSSLADPHEDAEMASVPETNPQPSEEEDFSSLADPHEDAEMASVPETNPQPSEEEDFSSWAASIENAEIIATTEANPRSNADAFFDMLGGPQSAEERKMIEIARRREAGAVACARSEAVPGRKKRKKAAVGTPKAFDTPEEWYAIIDMRRGSRIYEDVSERSIIAAKAWIANLYEREPDFAKVTRQMDVYPIYFENLVKRHGRSYEDIIMISAWLAGKARDAADTGARFSWSEQIRSPKKLIECDDSSVPYFDKLMVLSQKAARAELRRRTSPTANSVNSGRWDKYKNLPPDKMARQMRDELLGDLSRKYSSGIAQKVRYLNRQGMAGQIENGNNEQEKIVPADWRAMLKQHGLEDPPQ